MLGASAALAERGRALAAKIPAIKRVIADGPAAEGALASRAVVAAEAPTLARRATGFNEGACSPHVGLSPASPRACC